MLYYSHKPPLEYKNKEPTMENIIIRLETPADYRAVEAFDATFPEKEKKWMPSQEEFYIYSHSSVVR